jgi:Arc/MetJ family transcription regulator
MEVLMHTEEVIRRTSINLDFGLVDEAKQILGTTETTETVHRALREVIRRERLRQLVAQPFEMTDEELRRLRTWRTADDAEQNDVV